MGEYTKYNTYTTTQVRNMKVGSTIVNKLYVGGGVIKSAYLGNKLVYGDITTTIDASYYIWDFKNIYIYIKPEQTYKSLKQLNYNVKVYLNGEASAAINVGSTVNLSLSNNNVHEVNNHSMNSIVRTTTLNGIDIKVEMYCKLTGDYLQGDFTDYDANKTALFHCSCEISNENTTLTATEICSNDMIYQQDNSSGGSMNVNNCTAECNVQGSKRITNYTTKNYYLKMFIECD